MAVSIFSKVALERLSTPEQLDQATRVTSPIGWLALLAVGVLVAAALVWSLMGTAPVKVKGHGILLAPGGVFDVVSTSQGRLRAYLVGPGDVVQAGQPVVTVEQPELQQQLESALSGLAALRARRDHILAFQDKDRTSQQALRERQQATLLQSIGSQETRLVWLEERAAGENSLVEKGFASRQKYLDTMVEIAQVRDSISSTRSQLQQLDAGEITARLAGEREVLNLDIEIAAADIHQQLERDSRIVSPYTGTVVEMKVSEGEVVTPGLPLFALLPPRQPGVTGDGNDLTAIIYVPPDQGKNVQPGMVVQVAPGTVRREEFGTMEARVVSVATIPSSEEGMLQTLKNRALVQTLSQGGAPFEVRAVLVRDPDSPSGFKWSSRGPDQHINTGTLAQADIVIRRMRIITLVIPPLEQLLRVEGGA